MRSAETTHRFGFNSLFVDLALGTILRHIDYIALFEHYSTTPYNLWQGMRAPFEKPYCCWLCTYQQN